MTTENLPLALLNRHIGALDLSDPLYMEDENDLFDLDTGSGLVQGRQGRTLYESAVVFLPKSKALIDMTLALVSGMVALNGKVILVGSNDAGIRSAKEAYEKNIGPVEQKMVGNHSALYVGSNKRLAASKKLEDFLSFVTTEYRDEEIKIASIPGVFSSGELDDGTRMLLDHIPFGGKKVLDVGCGAGIIGALYKKKNPSANVTMSDKSKLAIFATKKTLEKNGLTANVLESDVFDRIDGRFDVILCNPPFHKGVSTDYSFIERFVKGAKEHLATGGEVYVVANAFLPYEDPLSKYIGPTETLADNKRFRVYRSRPVALP